jgi:hypothetical protein
MGMQIDIDNRRGRWRSDRIGWIKTRRGRCIPHRES